MAAGHMKKGALLFNPKIFRSIETSVTFRRILGRSITLRMISRLRLRVTRSVAADE